MCVMRYYCLPSSSNSMRYRRGAGGGGGGGGGSGKYTLSLITQSVGA